MRSGRCSLRSPPPPRGCRRTRSGGGGWVTRRRTRTISLLAAWGGAPTAAVAAAAVAGRAVPGTASAWPMPSRTAPPPCCVPRLSPQPSTALAGGCSRAPRPSPCGPRRTRASSGCLNGGAPKRSRRWRPRRSTRPSCPRAPPRWSKSLRSGSRWSPVTEWRPRRRRRRRAKRQTRTRCARRRRIRSPASFGRCRA
ncbi:hypothetical protein BU14_0288s0002 [Porphyra umbilicalis]|uniref:Uncharacterized protein n=1 Tax=Porphyra umbilicalis TaxID=2786 RepID=A0A1X6P0Q3_PORUM|nr:hypothetical protein BU14_0288s0002 [Porphyra umbilicalis]|eukprot:OSX74449.1 hypothetical protein BU14_0288s0002 [Porphyra umbilicalis]